jgi:hypothetical protein
MVKGFGAKQEKTAREQRRLDRAFAEIAKERADRGNEDERNSLRLQQAQQKEERRSRSRPEI